MEAEIECCGTQLYYTLMSSDTAVNPEHHEESSSELMSSLWRASFLKTQRSENHNLDHGPDPGS